MKKLLAVMLVVAATVAAAPTRAEDSGFSFGLRAAYGIPMGDLASGASFGDSFSGAIPLWLDAGYRFDKNWGAGVYFQYGFASVADATKNAAAADLGLSGITASGWSGTDVRVGLQGTYNFMPDASFAPWVGLGLGYEWATTKFDVSYLGQSGTASIGYHGFEAVLQVGGDFKASPNFSVGPFAAMTFAQFSSGTVDATIAGQTASQSGDITNKAFHEWLQLGLKGTFNL